MQRHLKIAILLFVSVVLTLAALIAIGVLFQRSTESYNRRVYKAPGEMIVVDDIELHSYKIGEDEPKVVFENGLGELFFEWGKVPELVSQTYSVLLYDRAGLGWSDPSPNEKNSSGVIKELRILLHKTGRQKVILVGKNLGALTALHSAFKYKHIITGVVLLEPIPPEADFINALLSEPELSESFFSRDWWTSELGLHRLAKSEEFGALISRYPDSLRKAAKARLIDHKHVQNSIKEYSELGTTAKMVLAGNQYKQLSIPVLIIRQKANETNLPKQLNEQREHWYKELQALSVYTKVIEVDNTKDLVQQNPELLVGLIENVVHISDSIYTNSLLINSKNSIE